MSNVWAQLVGAWDRAKAIQAEDELLIQPSVMDEYIERNDPAQAKRLRLARDRTSAINSGMSAAPMSLGSIGSKFLKQPSISEPIANKTKNLWVEALKNSNNSISGEVGPVFHKSPVEIEKFKNPKNISNSERYDTGGGVFGRNTYFDEQGNWVSNPQIRGDKIYKADLDFDKGFLISPETVKNIPKEFFEPNRPNRQWFNQYDPEIPTNILKNLDYDGLVIRGMDDAIENIQNKYDTSGARHYIDSELNRFFKSGGEPGTPEWLDILKKSSNIEKVFSRKELGIPADLRVLKNFQDQIVTFKPQTQVKNLEFLGDFSKDLIKSIKNKKP